MILSKNVLNQRVPNLVEKLMELKKRAKNLGVHREKAARLFIVTHYYLILFDCFSASIDSE